MENDEFENIKIKSKIQIGSYYTIYRVHGKCLGCIFRNVQNRFKDLFDGPDSIETWERIIQNIVDFEVELLSWS